MSVQYFDAAKGPFGSAKIRFAKFSEGDLAGRYRTALCIYLFRVSTL